jgi:hypothetical protein
MTEALHIKVLKEAMNILEKEITDDGRFINILTDALTDQRHGEASTIDMAFNVCFIKLAMARQDVGPDYPKMFEVARFGLGQEKELQLFEQEKVS